MQLATSVVKRFLHELILFVLMKVPHVREIKSLAPFKVVEHFPASSHFVGVLDVQVGSASLEVGKEPVAL